MSIIDQKAKVFGNIAAARTLSEGLPQLVTNPSFPSINNDGDSIAFLTDMLKSLVGIEKLREIVVDTLSYKLDEIELSIKKSIKLSLKELVNCGVDPSIPSYLKSNGSGIITEVNKIDFFDMMKVDPQSMAGSLMYNDYDIPSLTNSTDFNTFLYGTIQNDGTTETWNTTQQILDVRFDSVNTSPTPNNTLKFNANTSFDNKSLTEFNNTYVDSIDLFNSENLLNKLMDMLFGSITFEVNKTTSQVVKEKQIEEIINCIVNADENDVIDDNYFTFTNEQMIQLENEAYWKKNGIRIVETCGNAKTSIQTATLTAITSGITSAQIGQPKKEAISDGIKQLSQTVGNQSPSTKDSYALELNFIEGLISSIIKAIISLILSPKVISIFLINYKIIYGQNEEYDNAIDFMKQNKTLVKDISKSVRNAIISILLNTVLKEVSNLVSATAMEIATEKAKNQVAQILSLVGVPQEVIRLIKGL